MNKTNKTPQSSFFTLSSSAQGRDSGYYEKGAIIFLSWGYWFSSRTAGLLTHPYITMREIVREKFLRPLAIMPVVWWILSWMMALIIGRVGLMFEIYKMSWTIPVGRGLVFFWLWGSVFLVIWQVVLGYLYLRFKRL